MTCTSCTPTTSRGTAIAAGATVYARNRLTVHPPHDIEDITKVGVFHSKDRNASPHPDDFSPALLIDGVADPNNPLAWPDRADIVTLIGPGTAHVLTPGRWWRWLLVVTADEQIINRCRPLTII